jgi:hypothetical protein
VFYLLCGNTSLHVQYIEGRIFLFLQMATRVTEARYGVKLGPSFLVPFNWTVFLGVMNNYESLLPNNRALFDIPVAHTAIACLTSLVHARLL